MHLVRYRGEDGAVSIGVRKGDGVVRTGYSDMVELLKGGDAALAEVHAAAESGEVTTPAQILAPMDNPGKMFFLGMTYEQFRQDVEPDHPPYVYARVQSSIVGPGDDIRVPQEDAHLLYEGELVIVIGKPMFRVPAAEAMDYVAGYTIANDVTWTQWVHGGTKVGPQISLSKNADTFCPLGPDVVTADEIDPHDVDFTVTVNGETNDDILDPEPGAEGAGHPGVPLPRHHAVAGRPHLHRHLGRPGHRGGRRRRHRVRRARRAAQPRGGRLVR